MDEHPRQFELWRLLAGVTLIALAAAALRWCYVMVRDFGGGLFPTLCILFAIFATVVALGLLFRRVGEFLFWAIATLLRVLDLFW